MLLRRRVGCLGCLALLAVGLVILASVTQLQEQTSLPRGPRGRSVSVGELWSKLLEHVVAPLAAPRADFTRIPRGIGGTVGGDLSAAPRFYSFIDSDTAPLAEDEDGDSRAVEATISARRAFWDDDGNELLTELMGNSSLYGLKRRAESVRVAATWLKKPRPVVKWGAKPSGRARCPALLRKSGDGACRAASTGLLAWCLKPLQMVSGERFARFPVMRNAEKGKKKEFKVFTRGAGPQPVFDTFLGHNDVPRGFRFEHFLIHKGNSWALRVGPRPRPDFVAPKDLPDLYDFSTCAVVGSSASLLQREAGREIDAHTFVMRFNQAPTKGFEKHVGGKTSLRLQNQERTGAVPGDSSPTCLVKGYNFKHDRKCALLALSPQFMLYTKFYWYFHRMPGPGGQAINARISSLSRDVSRIKMSTGMMGLALALNLCGNVDLYGFSGGRGHYYRKTSARLSDATPFEDRHPWPIERACLRQLSNKLQVVHIR